MSKISNPNPDKWQTEPEGLTLPELRSDGWHGEPWPHVFASLGVRGFPIRPGTKKPYFANFYERATRNHAKIARWLKRWPDAGWAIITGAESGIICLDVDRKFNADGKVIVWGFESLHRAGIICPSAVTPTARTPRGGFRQLFRHPNCWVKTGDLVLEGEPVPGIEVFGDGLRGYCIIAGAGYLWLPHYSPTLALAPCTPWMIMADDQHHAAPSAPPAPIGGLSAYGEKVIRSARQAILTAPSGTRHATLLRVAYSVAGYVDGFGLPASFALDELERAALAQSRSAPRPTSKEILKTVRGAFAAGLRYQRKPRR
jgi:Bifunctional DNA primase/polymerase, N-terminal